MLRISLLGEQTVVDDASGVVPTRSSRAMALVGLLASSAGTRQSRHRVAGLFWPESGEAQALTNLRREIHQLRQRLGASSPVVVSATDLAWSDRPDVRVDVRTFALARSAALRAFDDDDLDGGVSAATAAIAEYRGDFLPGLDDDWAAEIRGDLAAQCVELCDLVCTARGRVGDPAGALEPARRRIALAPLEEYGYRQLMQLQAALGDRAAAVSTYHRCATVLERELGVAPDRGTRAVLDDVLRTLGPSPGPPPADDRPTGRPPIVGRDVDLDVLLQHWEAAAKGHAAAVLVTGGAGVGKTHLVGELGDRARRAGAVVANSRCFAASARLTLAPVADWLQHPVMADATEELDDEWRAEVGRLLRSGTARRGQPGAARAMADAWQRRHFYEGLARGLLLPDRPTLLVLDDIQWCDEETLAFLAFLLTSAAPDAPVMLIATLRDDADVAHHVLHWIRTTRATGVLREHVLTPLDRAATEALAEAVAGRPLARAELDLLYATTSGFPLFVVEAVRSGIEGRSAARPGGDLAAVLRERLDQASEAARDVAGLAAAVGTSFGLDLLTEASDLPDETVVAALDELWRRRIVREVGDDYDFSHDLVRDVAYARVSPPRQWLLHRRIAGALELLHPDDLDLVAAQLADQYVRGGRPERAVVHYRRAAEVAAGVFAHNDAIRLFQAALSIIGGWPPGAARDRQELTILQSMAAPLNARYGYTSPMLQRTLERSLVLAERVGDRDVLLDAMTGLWTSRYVQGRIADAYRLAERALELADRRSDRRSAAHFAVGGSALALGRPAEALDHLQRAATVGRGSVSLIVGTRPDVHATAWAAHAHWLLGDPDGAARCRTEAVSLARAVHHPYNLAVALAYGAITDQLRDDVASVRTSVDELHELCARYGFAYYREWALVLRGWSSEDGSGAASARAGVDALRAAGSFARMPYWLGLLGEILMRDGDDVVARATLDAALVAGRTHHDLWWLPEVMRLRAAFDPPGEAVQRLRAAVEMAQSHGSSALVARCLPDLARWGVDTAADGVRPGTDREG